MLHCIADGLTEEFMHKFDGKEVEILVEDKKTKEGFLQGYTDRYIKVCIDGKDALRGQFIKSRLTLTNKKPCGILLSYSI